MTTDHELLSQIVLARKNLMELATPVNQFQLQQWADRLQSLLGGGWSGWAVQYEGKPPKLFGAKEIAELNFNPEENCRLIFLREVSND